MRPPSIAKVHLTPRPWWARLLHRWIARLIFMASLSCEVLSWFRSLSRAKTQNSPVLTIPASVQSGNLFFGSTNSIRAKWLQKHLRRKTYTHVGILKQRGNQWYILHACPGKLGKLYRDGGVREDPWDEFVADAGINACAYYRMREGSNTALLELAEALARRRVPFDIHYDLEDARCLYCTEYIWHLGLQLGQDWVESRFHDMHLLGIRSLAIIPDAIAASPELERIRISAPS